MIVALQGLAFEYNTIKAVIRGRETLVSLKELRSQLRVEESTLPEVTKQVHLISTMLAQSSKSGLNMGSYSGLSQFHESHSLQQMTFPTQFSQMPVSGPFAFVSQSGSGSYNNFRGNTYKNKGKGKKFFSGS